MKIIITDCDHTSVDIEAAVCAAAGIEMELKQCHTEEDLIEQCKDADIFINQYAPITRRVMENLPNLKFVVRYGVGVNNVDLAAATDLGVQVGNVPDYGMNEVADQAIAFLMALTRKVVLMNEYTKTQKWDYSPSIPLYRPSTRTVGVVGLGRIGRNFAKKAFALGYKVIGYDAFDMSGHPDCTSIGLEQVSLEELQERSDIVSLHCPLLPETTNLFDAAAFARMKDGSYIINCSRGGIIDEDALIAAVESGKIAGAGLDCVVGEPLAPGAKLLCNDKILVTPHMAWYSEEAAEELKRKAAEEAVSFAKGEAIRYPVNKLAK
ncbi:MAG: C-terminal binding protein [Lachnospiraceae bacterium]|nr:C-terminal binding protein [Lachnospiraceae bacterium]